MGGILSGLIGGLAKGSIGGYLRAGEIKREQEEQHRNILTQMHMNRLNDWENLSPAEKQVHVDALENLWPEMKKSGALRVGVALANGVHQAVPPPPQVQAPAQASLSAPPTLDTVYGEMGATDASQRTPAMEKFAQQELFNRNKLHNQLAEADQMKEQGIQRNVQAMRKMMTPDEITNFEASLRSPGYYKAEQGGTWSQPINYTDPSGTAHRVIQHTKRGTKIDVTTGQELPIIPSDWTIEAKPIDRAPTFTVDQNNNQVAVNTNKVAKDLKKSGATTAPTGIKVRQGVPTFQPLVGATGAVEGRWNNRTGQMEGITPSPNTPELRRTPPPTAEKTQSANLRASEQKIKNLGALFNPAYVGPAAGPAFDVLAKLPEPLRLGKKLDPKQAEFVTANSVLKNEVIKLITGAQMGEKEAERILKQVPETSNPPEVWQARYKITLQNVEMLKRIMQEQGIWTSDTAGSPNRPASQGGKPLNSKSGNKILSITLSPNQ